MRHFWLVGWWVAALLAGCAQGSPFATVAPDGGPDASARTGKAALALFVGLDDYTGHDTQSGLKYSHAILASVGSSAKADLFMAGDSNVKGDGFRTRITAGQAWGQGFEPLGELKTNDTPALRNYLNWVGRESGTKQLHLSIATHGGGYGGILLDHDGQPEVPAASMTLQKAYKALSKGYTGGRIPTLTFDACMMSAIEVGEALKGTVAVMTGSEDFSMGASMPYDELARALAEGRGHDGEAYAKFVATAVIQKGKHGDKGSRQWSAIALDQRFERVVRATDKLATALLKAMPAEGQAIRQAAADTRMFAIMADYKEHYGDFYQRDLIEFTQTLRKRVQSPIVREAAQDVEVATRAAVLANMKHPSEAMANGLAIFLPHGLSGDKAAKKLKRYEDSVFARHTRWDEFLTALNK